MTFLTTDLTYKCQIISVKKNTFNVIFINIISKVIIRKLLYFLLYSLSLSLFLSPCLFQSFLYVFHSPCSLLVFQLSPFPLFLFLFLLLIFLHHSLSHFNFSLSLFVSLSLFSLYLSPISPHERNTTFSFQSCLFQGRHDTHNNDTQHNDIQHKSI